MKITKKVDEILLASMAFSPADKVVGAFLLVAILVLVLPIFGHWLRSQMRRPTTLKVVRTVFPTSNKRRVTPPEPPPILATYV